VTEISPGCGVRRRPCVTVTFLDAPVGIVASPWLSKRFVSVDKPEKSGVPPELPSQRNVAGPRWNSSFAPPDGSNSSIATDGWFEAIGLHQISLSDTARFGPWKLR